MTKYIVAERRGKDGVTVGDKLYRAGEALPALSKEQAKALLEVGAIKRQKEVKQDG